MVARAIARLRRALPLILEDTTNGLSGVMRELLGELAERLRMLDDACDNTTSGSGGYAGKTNGAGGWSKPKGSVRWWRRPWSRR